MNTIFTVIFIASSAILLCIAPESFLSTLLHSASKSATLCLSLIATYSVWLGLMQVWEDSGLSKAVSFRLRPFAKKLFKTDNEEALDAICMNVSVNMLGISGAATPYGIKAVKLLDGTPQAEYASAMFFVLNATSLQIFPTTLIAAKTAMQSASPNDIVLPIMLTSFLSTLLGVLLTATFVSRKTKYTPPVFEHFHKSKGAGVR